MRYQSPNVPVQIGSTPKLPASPILVRGYELGNKYPRPGGPVIYVPYPHLLHMGNFTNNPNNEE